MSQKWPLILSGLLMITFGAALLWAQEKTPEAAQTIVDAAVKKAGAENKVVFIHSGASW